MRWPVILFLGLGISAAHAAGDPICIWLDGGSQLFDIDSIIKACDKQIAQHDESGPGLKDETFRQSYRRSLADALKTRGLAYEAKEDFDNAIKNLNAAVILEKDDRIEGQIGFICARGNYYVRRGENEIAIGDFDRAVRDISDNRYLIECLIGRSNAYLNTNAFDKALTDANDVISTLDSSTSGFKGWISDMIQPDEIKKLNKHIIERFKVQAMHVRGNILEKKGDCVAAVKEFVAVKSIDPVDRGIDDDINRVKDGCKR